MAAEEYSPDPFDESPPKEMKYLKNPKKMTITEFELLPKKLITSKKLEEGKIYYIEDVSRRKKDYREVYQGMHLRRITNFTRQPLFLVRATIRVSKITLKIWKLL